MFTVMDRDTADADDLLGKVSLPVAKLLPSGFDGEVKLQETGKATAFLKIRCKLRPLHDAEAVANSLKATKQQARRPPPPKPPKMHDLEVTVKAAKGLRDADWGLGKSKRSDAYVAVSVPGTTTEFKTPVVEDCSDPEWNFTKKISVGPKETLVFKMFDKDQRTDELLGSVSLDVSGILSEGFSGSMKLEGHQGSPAELVIAVRVLGSTPKKAPTKQSQETTPVLAYAVDMTVMSARDLRNADWSLTSSGHSDAYCVVEIPGSDRGFQTDVVEDSSNPVWNKTQKLVLYPKEMLMFTVMDRDTADADDLLGKVSLPVAKLLPSGFDGEVKLQETGKATAFLKIRCKLRPLHDAEAVANSLKATKQQARRPPPPKPQKMHDLEVTVKAAKGLRDADWGLGKSKKSDAYVAVSVPGTTTEFKTPVVEDCSDPEWNFTKKISVGPKETLVFKVFDKDQRTDELLGSVSLDVSGILSEGFSGSMKLEGHQGSPAELVIAVRVLGSTPKKAPTKQSQETTPVLAYAVDMTVMSARDLRNADWSLTSSGHSDAYCVVEIPGSDRGFQTDVVEDSSNPVWNKTQKLVLYPKEMLMFTVMDRDTADADDLLGKVSLPVAKLLPSGFDDEVKLQETGKAMAFLKIRCKLRPLHDAEAVANSLKATKQQARRPPPPKPPKMHDLEVTVKAAKGLRDADWGLGKSKKSDAYVAVSVPGTTTEFKTPVVEDCSDPEWNFTKKISVGPKETLVFKVFDKDQRTDELLGSVSLDVSGILSEGFSGSMKLEGHQGSPAELVIVVRVLSPGRTTPAAAAGVKSPIRAATQVNAAGQVPTVPAAPLPPRQAQAQPRPIPRQACCLAKLAASALLLAVPKPAGRGDGSLCFWTSQC